MHVAKERGAVDIGSYWHLLPKHSQAKRAIWNGIDHKSGRRFIDMFFPDALAKNATDMFIERECGSTWQLLGSDNYDRAVGSNPRGIVFSEWALCDPRAWDYFRPILRANKGWAIFISTFRGRNHMWQMYQNLLDNPDWFVSLKTVDDTQIITLADIEKERAEGMSERLIQQEYYCKPAPPTSLGPFARVFEALEAVGNVRELPELSKTGAHHVAVGCAGEYVALVECVTRGANRYIFGGAVERNAALHEILAGNLTRIKSRDALLTVNAELVPDAVGLKLPLRTPVTASQAEASLYLERAVVSPSSVATAALTGAINTWIDEEGDPDIATEAVFAALTQLASLGNTQAWSPGVDYTLRDRSAFSRINRN